MSATLFTTGSWKRHASRFAAAPFALQAYTVFLVLATLFGLLLGVGLAAGSEPLIQLHRATRGVTRFANPFLYSFGLYFCFTLLFQYDRPGLDRTRLLRGATSPLFVFIFCGVAEVALQKTVYQEPETALTGQLRLLWTLVIPALWQLALTRPAVRKFCAAPYRQ